MSVRVLVIPENVRYDQYLAVPVVEAAVAAAGCVRAIVRPCQDPRFRGYAQATDSARLQSVFQKYGGMVDLFVLCLDRDGEARRDAQGQTAEQVATNAGVTLFALVAHQEMEAWALAGASNFRPTDFGFASWSDVRADPDIKERAFEPYASSQRLFGALGGGRAALGREAGAAYAKRVRSRCPEIIAFEDRVRTWRRS